MYKRCSLVLAILLGAGSANGQSVPTLSSNAELVSDAAGRPSLLASQGGFGRDDKGFYLAQGDARVYIAGMVQFRYYLNLRDTETASSDFTNGFENRRARLISFGQVDKDTSYRIQAEFRGNGNMVLQDAFASYKLGEGWKLSVGQFKLPMLREELVTDLLQLTAERSVTNAVFTQGRSQGIELAHEAASFRVSMALSDGLVTDNTDFTAAREADFAITARAEYKAAGDWNQFRDFSGWRDGPFGFLVGAAAHYQSGGESGGTANIDSFQYTADVSLEGSGWNAFGAFIGRHRDELADDLNDFGIVVQGGVFVSDQVELFARYDVVIPDSDRPSDPDTFSTLTAGATYFLVPGSHAAHLRAHVSWFLDAQSESIVPSSTTTGLLVDSQGDQVAIIIEYAMQW